MVACSGCLREAGSVNYSVNWTPLPIESSGVFSGLLWGVIVTEHPDLDSLAVVKTVKQKVGASYCPSRLSKSCDCCHETVQAA